MVIGQKKRSDDTKIIENSVIKRDIATSPLFIIAGRGHGTGYDKLTTHAQFRYQFWREFENVGVCQRPFCDLIGCPVFWRRREH